MLMPEDQQRLIVIASTLLNFAGGKRLNTVLLNKALFYFDLTYLRDFGEVFTHSPYIALPQGPVVANYDKRLIKPLVKQNIAIQESIGDALPVSLLNFPNEFSHVNDEVKQLARSIAEYFSKLTSTQASNFSHENPGWRMAYRNGLKAGKSPLSINMTIAMQQILEEDPWLSEPVSDTTLEDIYAVEEQVELSW